MDAIELLVPRRTSDLNPATGDMDVNFDDESRPGENSGDAGVVTPDMGAELGGTEEGSWYSLRTTTSVICRAFRASLLEAYSRASVKLGGSVCASRMDVPASRGDEMRCFSDDMMNVRWVY